MNTHEKKRLLILQFDYVIKWLTTNSADANTLNKLYCIIFQYKNNEIELLLKKNRMEIESQIIKYFKNNKSSNDIIAFMKFDSNHDYLKDLEKDLVLKQNLYFNLDDLNIKLLPNFINYHYFSIIVWIFFCKVYNKESPKKHQNYFLYDIYLFQNETNVCLKINYLIVILKKIQNYIQFFDYNAKLKK